MRKKGIRSACLLLLMTLSFMLPVSAGFAADNSVRVALPDFPVTLNGNPVDNLYREYPLIVYKDITYLPMTWYDTRLLGLVTDWSPEAGLAIRKEHVTSAYNAYRTGKKNAKMLQAAVPSFGITVNGTAVNNAEATYPLLTYNGVTYFPLTWAYAHDAFGWAYSWDSAEGLSIRSDQPQLTAANLPSSAGDNGVAVYKGYYYYAATTGTTTTVFRSPTQDASIQEQVYSYETDAYGFHSLRFEIRDNELWLVYHVGRAIMGSDVYARVDADGKAAVEQRGYLDFRNTYQGTLLVRQGVPPVGNNLALVPAGGGTADAKPVGAPDLIYGWHTAGDGLSAYSNRSTAVAGDAVYVLASPYPAKAGEENRIYRVHLKTNETVRVVSSEVEDFKLLGNKLYYVKAEDGLLYVSGPDGTGERQVSDRQVGNWYAELGGEVYYSHGIPGQAFHLYKANADGDDQLVLQEAVESIQLDKGRLICKLAEGEAYGLKILNASGELVLVIADQVSQVFAYDGALLLVLKEDKAVILVK